MRTTIWTLVLLLLATNAAWWFARGEAPVPEAPLHDAQSAREQSATKAAASNVAGLEAELQRARARIEQLEAAARTPAKPPPAANAAQQAAREAAAAGARRAAQLQRGWMEAVLQTGDLLARQKALDEIRQALLHGDPFEVAAALRALAGTAEVDYDKATFRALVLPHLQSADAGARAAALYALYNTKREPEDRATVLGMVGDPSPQVRGSLAHLVLMYHKGILEGEAADAVVRLMDDADAEVRRSALNGIWGAKVDTRIEDRCLAMLADPQLRHDAVYFGLSTFAAKSPRVVTALVSALTDANPEIAGRAAWGLQTGVAAESHAEVADAIVRLLASRSNSYNREDYMLLLRQLGSARNVPDLEVLLGNPGMTDAFRKELEPLIAQLRQR
ncbi:MAG: hypothetical protein IT456_28575 [Planctomycetes bacterium]|nr:hypothetical protein [Planctomycetota bacterium]